MTRQHAYAARQGRYTPACLPGRVERLLFQVPIYIAVASGASVMLARFILVLKEDLQSNPDDWRSLFSLIVIMGAASFLIVVACAALGAVIGFALQGLIARARLRGH